MNKNNRWIWILFSVLMVMALILTPVLALPFEQDTGTPEIPDITDLIGNRTSGDSQTVQRAEEVDPAFAAQKIDPMLRELAQGMGKEEVDVYVAVQGSFDADKYLDQVIVRPALVGDIYNVYGRTTAANINKIVQEPSVIAVVASDTDMVLEKPYTPEPESIPSTADLQSQMNALMANELTYAEAASLNNDVGSAGWFDVLDGHNSSAAWEKGFTGQGVKVGVLDDGVDFAHPDLQGTYARILDVDSPYYGWPMAFSQVSLRYFAAEVLLQDVGAKGITENWTGTRWTDSQMTVTSSPSFGGATFTASYQPIGSAIAYQYTIADTSVSGKYKLGSHSDRNLNNLYGHRVAVLVVDEHSSGNYDTVYVDLDNDKDFTDEKPVTQDSPEVYRDMDGDGYADISGGLLVWISDGENVPPAADWLWGIECGDEVGTLKACPDNGELVLFTGAFDSGYTHGTQCASNIAGQGVVNDGLSAQPFRVGGMVQGTAKNVGVVDFGNHYYSGTDEDEFLVAALGYDGIPDSGDEIQITSNSYGTFSQMWGGWGYIGRLITSINTELAPKTVWLFSAGNEGPGYGPQEGDGGPTVIQVGSSSQYGSTNWDSIASADQIVYGDPSSFFSKGPNRDGSSGLDILANGGRGAGDEGLNYYGFNGAESWSTWGGTSRSAPAAAGNLALVFQAYHDRYGDWPTWDVAKALFKSGATNSVSSPFYQGGGIANADRSTDLAAGIYGVYAQPDEWQVGDWKGTDYLNFANVAVPGETYTQTYTVSNPSGYEIDVDIVDGVMLLMDSTVLTFTTANESEESNFNFHSPDYLMELDADMIPADAELMVVRYVHDFDSFVPNYDPDTNPHNGSPNSSWRFMVYNWTDVNGDDLLWEDANNNGVVNHTDNGQVDNDGFQRLDFANSDIQEGEYIRMDYEFGGLAIPIAIHDPLERMADGYFFGFQHRNNDGTVPTTTFDIRVEFYKRADWDWLSLSESSLTLPAESEATFDAVATIPNDAEPGVYEGVIYMNDPGTMYHDAHETALPVVVNVLADLPDEGSIELGGKPMADTLYQNSWTNGYFNFYGGGWTGAGDWRHYFFEVDEADMDNGNLLINTHWNDGFPTDINTWLLGPTYDCASNGVDCNPSKVDLGQPDPSTFGPYTLWPIAGSDSFQAGASYEFSTSTGGPSDWLLGPTSMPGLHEIALHNVLYSGDKIEAQFQSDVGTLGFETVMASDGTVSGGYGGVDAQAYTVSGTLDFEFTPTLALPDFEATLAGGLETFNSSTMTVTIPDAGGTYLPFDANNVFKPVMVTQEGATELGVHLDTASGQDPDMFLIYDKNNNGVPDEGVDTVVGSSGNSTGTAEEIVISNPKIGRYFATFHGYTIDPTSGVEMDWKYWITFPGELPVENVEVYSDTVSIDQDSIFDPITASYSRTVTTTERTSALYVDLTLIPAGNDVDLYISDASGIIKIGQEAGNTDESLMILPESGEYRLEANKVYTIWVHGVDVPSGAITPHLEVTVDSLNVWLSAEHSDVSVSEISAGEMVSVTLNFEKEDWAPGDSDLSARFIAGPSVLPGSVDELVVIERVEEPLPPDPNEWDLDNLEVDYSVESSRGDSSYKPWGVQTALAAGGEVVTWTLTVTNHDPNSVDLDLAAEVDNWFQNFFYADPYFTQTFNSITESPTKGTCVYDGTSVWVNLVVTLEADESVTCAWSATTDASMEVLDDHLSAVWEWNEFSDIVGVADVYYRSFRMSGSTKTASAASVAPGETFNYEIALANPSAVDKEIQVVDTLPTEVDFVSANNGMVYDANSHSVSWSGLLPGSSLSTVDFDIEVTAKSDVEEGTIIENEAMVSLKPLGGSPVAVLSEETLVDDGMNPDLAVDKQVDSLIGFPKDVLLYTIVIENNGDEVATGVVVQDDIPSYLTVDESSITGGATYANGMMTWEGDIAVDGSQTITYRAMIDANAPINLALINGATVSAENAKVDLFNSAVTEIKDLIKLFLPVVFK